MTNPVTEMPIANLVYLQVAERDGGKSYYLRAERNPFSLVILDKRSKTQNGHKGIVPIDDALVKKVTQYTQMIQGLLQPQAELFMRFHEGFLELGRAPDVPNTLQRFFEPTAQLYRRVAFADQFTALGETRYALDQRLTLFEGSNSQVLIPVRDAYQSLRVTVHDFATAVAQSAEEFEKVVEKAYPYGGGPVKYGKPPKIEEPDRSQLGKSELAELAHKFQTVLDFIQTPAFGQHLERRTRESYDELIGGLERLQQGSQLKLDF